MEIKTRSLNRNHQARNASNHTVLDSVVGLIELLVVPQPRRFQPFWVMPSGRFGTEMRTWASVPIPVRFPLWEDRFVKGPDARCDRVVHCRRCERARPRVPV